LVELLWVVVVTLWAITASGPKASGTASNRGVSFIGAFS
jgi:hypothetical protein